MAVGQFRDTFFHIGALPVLGLEDYAVIRKQVEIYFDNSPCLVAGLSSMCQFDLLEAFAYLFRGEGGGAPCHLVIKQSRRTESYGYGLHQPAEYGIGKHGQ